MRTVLIVLFDDVQSLDVTGPLEVFAHLPGYQVSTASLGAAPVTTSSGLRLTPDADLRHRAQRDNAPRARRLASVCTGAFLLAEAGLLDGRRVTTHWAHCQDLAAQYPDITVDPDPIFIKDATLATSAGVTAGIDLALALVEDDLGRDAALAVARQLVVFLRRPGSQAQFSAQLAAQTATRPPLRDIQHWITEHPSADLSVDTLAQRASLSPRQFARAFAAQVGMPPGRYVDRARLEAARRRLEDTAADVAATARACGYGTPEAMRRAFVRALGVSPAEYRRRFRPAPHLEESHADRHPAL